MSQQQKSGGFFSGLAKAAGGVASAVAKSAGTAATKAIQQNTNFAKARDAREVQQDQEKLGEFANLSKFKELVEAGAVALIKPEYLVQLAKEEKILPRRQEVPKSAHAGVPAHPKSLIVVSYPWLSKEHPDPEGYLLLRVAAYLQALLHGADDLEAPDEEKTIESFNNPGIGAIGSAFGNVFKNAAKSNFKAETITDFAVFWDFMSLHQHERTAEETKLFKQALGCMEVWYGHTETTILRLPITSPNAKNPTPYDQRGWCTFESQVVALAGKGERVLSPRTDIDDDGWRERLGMQKKRVLQGTREVLFTQDALPLPAPLVPAEFTKLLLTKTFTNNSDSGTVSELYKNFFHKLMPSVNSVRIENSTSDDTVPATARFFSSTKALLGADFNLQRLTISRNPDLTAAGVCALLEHLDKAGFLRTLSSLGIEYSPFGRSGHGCALVALKLLRLLGNRPDQPPAKLERLTLWTCELDDVAIAALAYVATKLKAGGGPDIVVNMRKGAGVGGNRETLCLQAFPNALACVQSGSLELRRILNLFGPGPKTVTTVSQWLEYSPQQCPFQKNHKAMLFFQCENFLVKAITVPNCTHCAANLILQPRLDNSTDIGRALTGIDFELCVGGCGMCKGITPLCRDCYDRLCHKFKKETEGDRTVMTWGRLNEDAQAVIVKVGDGKRVYFGHVKGEFPHGFGSQLFEGCDGRAFEGFWLNGTPVESQEDLDKLEKTIEQEMAAAAKARAAERAAEVAKNAPAAGVLGWFGGAAPAKTEGGDNSGRGEDLNSPAAPAGSCCWSCGA